MARFAILVLAALSAVPAHAAVYVSREYYWTGSEWRYDIVGRHYTDGSTTTWGPDSDFGPQGQGSPYVLEADVYVDLGGTLNVGAGVTVQVAPARGIYVAGKLDARGTEESHVLFTSTGGVSPGSWDEICVYGPGANDTAFRYCDLSYAGSHAHRTKGGFAHYANGNIVVKDCSPLLDHVVSSHAAKAGLCCYGSSSPTVTNSTFTNCEYGLAIPDDSYAEPQSAPLPIRGNVVSSNSYGAYMSAQAAGALDASNNFNGNAHNAIQISLSQVQSASTWRRLQGDPVWHLYDDVTCPAGKSLTIEPGCVVKFEPLKSLYVAGTLTANGAPTLPIYFTSAADDSVGGDSNGDGSATRRQRAIGARCSLPGRSRMSRSWATAYCATAAAADR